VKRTLVGHLEAAHGVSERRACKTLGFHRSVMRYEGTRGSSDAPVRARIEEIARVRIRYGYRRIHTLMRREGWQINHKRVHRIYREAGLNLRTKRPKRRRMAAHRLERPLVQMPNELWCMDFMTDALFDGRRFRVLTVIDQCTRECLAIYAAQSIKAAKVIETMDKLIIQRGIPARIQTDNGSEFASKALDRWAYDNSVTLDFSRPGKPTDNPFIESFNGSFRDECLNVHWFLSLEDAWEKIGLWRWDYNNERPHSALGNQPPRAYARQLEQALKPADPIT
jgi:putative transposase